MQQKEKYTSQISIKRISEKQEKDESKEDAYLLKIVEKRMMNKGRAFSHEEAWK